MEGKQHRRVKYGIKDFLEERNWNVYVEHAINLKGTKYGSHGGPPPHIRVDLFAVKENSSIIFEIGTARGGEERIEFLEKIVDEVYHLPYGKKPYDGNCRYDFPELDGVIYRIDPEKSGKLSPGSLGKVELEL